ncbi:MAG: hypothetical protein M0P26_05800 [Bacteroidales bacterium]|nr:hypothetical protein [Bacteroidales bacterium]
MNCKKTNIIAFAFFLISISICGQEKNENIIKLKIDSIQKLIDSKTLIMDKLNLNLKDIQNLIDHEKSIMDKLNFELRNANSEMNNLTMQKMMGENYVCVMGTNIKKEIQGYDIICSIRTGDKVKIIDKGSGFYKIYFNGIYGYVNIEAIENEKVLFAKKQAWLQKQVEDSTRLVEEKVKLAEKNANLAKENEKKIIEEKRLQKEILSNLTKKYGKINGNNIYNNKIWLGATKAMVLESWGKPIDINKSVGTWGVHEQWVYDFGSYLYFEDGILKSWQD